MHRFNFAVHLLLVVLIFACTSISAQQWSDVPAPTRFSGERLIVPAEFRTVSIGLDALYSALEDAPKQQDMRASESPLVFALPTPEGDLLRFRVSEFSVFAPALQARYPMVRSYAGQGIEDPTATLRCDISPKGFHAMVIRNGETFYIDPFSSGNTATYMSYTKRAFFATTDKAFHESPPVTEDMQFDPLQLNERLDQTKKTKPVHDRPVLRFGQQRTESGSELRTYRLALACTGEYAQFHGGTVPDVIAAYNTSLTRVNGVYEREVAIHMEIVANVENVIYLDGSTDPFDNGNGSAMLNQNQSACDSNIGSANYDIGHVYSTGGGGIAQLNSPCGSGKARGVTGQGSPVGDPFDIDYVCHEMGHQFGGNHTQNNSCNRASSAAFEPGSASTIMGYAGICPPNLQSNSDDYFHIHSFNEMKNFSVNGNGNSCATITSTGNNVPTVDAGADYVIPGATPFELTATGTDADPTDILTYTWEQYDLGPSTAGGDNDLSNPSGNQPTFRSFKGTTDPTRVFPRIQDLVNNTTVIGEHLPDYDRGMTFRCSVRDNRAGGGGVNEDEMEVTVDGDSGPFLVSFPNTNVQLPAGGVTPIAWDVAGTDGAPVNCSSVDIFLSTDGGFTYPTLLASGVPNTGGTNVTLPNVETTTARIKIKGNGNVFFDISDGNLEISASVVSAQYDLGVNSISGASSNDCAPSISPTVQIINLGTETITSATIEYFVDGVSQGTVAFNGSISIGQTADVAIGAVTPATDGSHTFTATVSAPNGQADENAANDSQTTNFSTVSNPILVDFNILTDCWGEELSWTLTGQSSGTVVAAIPTNTYGDQINVTEEFCLASGCYDLLIEDSYGDGLAGSLYTGCGVDGSYNVTDAEGNILVQMANANYGSAITESFCVTATVQGCTDDTACNYNADAVVDDGSCEFTSCAGCTDDTACNYDATATIDNGSCEFTSCAGCTDDTACNYDAAATIDNGTCEFTSCAGCTDDTACNYDAAATIDNGTCEFTSCAGCTDDTACNYDAAATIDNGTCEFTSCAGCTDDTACNYDAAATIDNGTCEFTSCAGCTDDTACNYDAAATIDNGTCEFASCACTGDLNSDGTIGVGDLLIILGEFGCSSNCIADLSGDGEVGTGDILELLSIFGNDCP